MRNNADRQGVKLLLGISDAQHQQREFIVIALKCAVHVEDNWEA